MPSELRPGPFGLLHRLSRSKEGSVVTIFAIAIFSLSGMVGAAVDISRYITTQRALQSAVDNAVMAAAVRQGDADSRAEAAKDLIDAFWSEKVRFVTPTVTVTEPNAGEITAIATADLPTTFMKIAGIDKMEVRASATAAFGNNFAEVALALDVTTSMEGSRMSALKDAAENLVDIAFDMPNSDTRLKMSVVPFARYVNVGVSNRGAWWLDVPNDVANSNPLSCNFTPSGTFSQSCQDITHTYQADGQTRTWVERRCTRNFENGAVCTVGDDSQTWRGCVGSRLYPANTEVSIKSSNRVPGLMNEWCNAPITQLTNKKGQVRDAIRDLWADGDTYIQSGLLWAWRTLSPDGPFGQAKPKNSGSRKVIVLMSDGENTISPTYPHHHGSDVKLADDLMLKTCNKIKADGITIFAVAFEITDLNIKDKLEQCASSNLHYFDAGSGVELSEAFERIGKGLVALHLKK